MTKTDLDLLRPLERATAYLTAFNALSVGTPEPIAQITAGAAMRAELRASDLEAILALATAACHALDRYGVLADGTGTHVTCADCNEELVYEVLRPEPFDQEASDKARDRHERAVHHGALRALARRL